MTTAVSPSGFIPPRLHALSLLLIALMASALLAGPLQAADTPPEAVPSGRDTQLDSLFMALKNAENEVQGRKIEQQIWLHWTQPDDPDMAQRMSAALEARRAADYAGAIDILNALIADYPGYAEAWNQRATVHFLMGDNLKSLEDIYETLVREPRHFGALTGRAMIRLRQGKGALAIQSLKTAVDIHPYLRERPLYEQLMEPFRKFMEESGRPLKD